LIIQAYKWLPRGGKPHWGTATIVGITEGQNVDGSATNRVSRDVKPCASNFEMDKETVNVSLRKQDYLRKWVYLVHQELEEARIFQERGTAS